MFYYKAVPNGDTESAVYLESKTSLSDHKVLKELVDLGELDLNDSQEAIVESITEDEFEENSF